MRSILKRLFQPDHTQQSNAEPLIHAIWLEAGYPRLIQESSGHDQNNREAEAVIQQLRNYREAITDAMMMIDKDDRRRLAGTLNAKIKRP